ncbi:SagB family peptide dehydrogenase [Pseudomonas sp. NPDC090233]|uniref:SagB family peptide dehydrogenase n=1 Tax=Pseudomonas sp. NPDC090233 TaxID=3364479 RepID=UPI00383AC109
MNIVLQPLQSVGPLESILRERTTVRAFTDKPVPLVLVSKILKYTLGFIDEREVPEASGLPEGMRKRRSSPSGGGLNATEGYVLIKNVEGVAPGVYYYDPHSHMLHVKSTELPDVGSLLSGQHFANGIPIGLFLTSRFDKSWWKYEHSRAYRMALLEVGHVAQTFQLIATALGLGTWPTGALSEKRIEPLLKLTNPNEQVLFFVGCGYGDGVITSGELASLV